jgi:hypothetical protein
MEPPLSKIGFHFDARTNWPMRAVKRCAIVKSSPESGIRIDNELPRRIIFSIRNEEKHCMKTGLSIRLPDYQAKQIIVLCMILVSGCGLGSRQLPSALTALPVRNCISQSESHVRYSDTGLETPRSDVHAKVAALAFTDEKQILWATYAFDSSTLSGQLGQFRLPDFRVARSMTLGPLDVRFARFNRDATMLVIAGADISEPWHVSVQMWNTTAGKVVSSPKPSLTKLDGLADLSLAPDAQWLLTPWHSGMGLTDPLDEKEDRGQGFVFSRGGSTGTRDVLTVSFDSTGKLFAFGTRDKEFYPERIWGTVELRTWNGRDAERLPPIKWSVFGFGLDLGRPFFESDHPPLRLAFDPSNHWLAVQTANALELRDITDVFLSKRGQVQLPESSWGIVAFDPSSSLLAVGHFQGMKVLSMPDLKIVLDKSGVQVTAITFSHDGCLLAWGDAEGTVHIINTPRP